MSFFAFPFLLVLFAAISYVLYFLYLKHVHSLLETISSENRSVNPNTVWILSLSILNFLSFMPLGFVLPKPINFLFTLFLIVFQFYLVAKIADSVAKEFTSRNIKVDNKPSFALGLWMCLLDFTWHLLTYLNYMMAAGIAYFVFLICFIVYWVEINNITKELKTTPRLVASEDSIFNNL